MNAFFSWSLVMTVTILGIFGSVIGLIVFTRKSLKSFPARMVFITLAIFDLLTLFFNLIEFSFGYFSTGIYVSIELCKINNIFNR